MEMDSFSPLGGTAYFELARTIANAAQASNAQGWQANQGQNGRYDIIDDYRQPLLTTLGTLFTSITGRVWIP